VDSNDMRVRQNASGGVYDRAIQSRAVNLRKPLRCETSQQDGGTYRVAKEKTTEHGVFGLEINLQEVR
jgi:hypothetical protein